MSRLDLGSNQFHDTPCVILARGEPIVELEYGDPHQLLVTVDVRDATGATVARLRRNAWAFANPAYAVTTHPGRLTLTEVATGRTLLAAEVVAPDHIHISEAHLALAGGGTFDVMPDGSARIGGILMSENTVYGSRVGISID